MSVNGGFFHRPTPTAGDPDCEPTGLGSARAEAMSCGKEAEEERSCRVCYCEVLEEEEVIRPCRCAGSLAYVHRSCLQAWMASSTTRAKRCLTCQAAYRFRKRRRRWARADLLRALSTVLVLAAAAVCYASLLPLYACATPGKKKSWVEWRPEALFFLPEALIAKINEQQWTKSSGGYVCTRKGDWDATAAVVYGTVKLSWVGLICAPFRFPDVVAAPGEWLHGPRVERLAAAIFGNGNEGPLVDGETVATYITAVWLWVYLSGGRAFGANMPTRPDLNLVFWLLTVLFGFILNLFAAFDVQKSIESYYFPNKKKVPEVLNYDDDEPQSARPAKSRD